MLHFLDVYHTRGEVLKVMHDELLLVRDEYSDTVLFGKQFKTPLSHLSTLLNLLETT